MDSADDLYKALKELWSSTIQPAPAATFTIDPPASKKSELNGPPRKNYAADAAVFKRETRERLDRLRKGGLTVARIREAANGAITDDQIMSILECKLMPVNVYRVLAAALDEIER